MDLVKYRNLFLEEAAEQLADMSRALLELEKDAHCADAIDRVFRAAHSVKGMAATLGYESITDLSHRLEDRMESQRARGSMEPTDLELLFRGLEALERMVGVVRDTGDSPPSEADLEAALATVSSRPREDSREPAREGEEPPEAAPEQDRSPQPASMADPAPSMADPARMAGESRSQPIPPVRGMAGSQKGASPSRAMKAPAPSPSVRVRTDTLDRFLSSVGEVILSSSQLRTVSEQDDRPRTDLSSGFDRMDRVVGDLQRRALLLRTAPLLRVMEPLPRVSRELARQLGKRVEVELRGAEIELDRSILDHLGDPLVHLLRNAVDHGIESPDLRRAVGKPESGRIRISARRERESIQISVSDDGAGIDLDAVRSRAVAAGLVYEDLAEDLPPSEIAALVFRPGLTTRDAVSETSGRGVGMDAVKVAVESLGGRVELESRQGLGTTVSLVVPITAAIQRVLLVGMAGETFALPVAKVERIVEVEPSAIEVSGQESFVLVDEVPTLLFDLAERIGLPCSSASATVPLVLAEVRDELVALRVERLEGQQEIYVKPVPTLLAGVRGLAGLTILGDGRPIFLIDVNQLI